MAPTQEGTFKLLTGTLNTYVKVGDSGTSRVQSFCPRCGSPIYSTSVGDNPKVHSLRVGTIRQRHQLVPKTQLWGRSSQGWLSGLGTMAKVEKQA